MKKLSLFLFILASPVAQAVELREALSLVYANDPELLAARSALRSTDETLAISNAGYRPTLSASGATEFRQIDDNLEQYDLSTMRSSLSIDQNIYSGGGTTAEVRRSRAEISVGQFNLRTTEQSVLIAAIDAYLSVLRDQTVLDAAIANENRLEKQLQATEDRFEFGEVTRTDVAQAEARLAAARADTIDADGNLKTSKANYVDTIGTQPISQTQPELPLGLPATLEDALNASEDVPSVRAAAFSLEASRHDIDVQHAGILPSLDLRGTASHVEDPSRSIARQTEFAASAVVTVPLFQGGAEYARIRQAKQRAIEDRYRVNDELRAAQRRIEAAWLDFQSATARLKSIDAQVRAAEIALSGVQQESLVGARTVLDILDQEQELFDAQVSQATTRFEQLLAGFSLAEATGMLTAEFLQLDVEIYDPLTNLRYTEDRWVGSSVRSVE